MNEKITGLRVSFLICSLLLPSFASAMTPGSTVQYFYPDKIELLNENEKKILDGEGCLVKAYRSEEGDNNIIPQSLPHPGYWALLNRGELAQKGQSDLAVVCKSKDTGSEYIRLIWGGSKQCREKISLYEESIYFSKHGHSEPYYGATLNIFKTERVMDVLSDLYTELATYTSDKWRLDKSEMPDIEHSALSYGGNYYLMYFCSNSNWIKFLDIYSDYVD